MTSQVITFVHATSSSLCVGQNKYQRFRILGQSDCRAEGQAHFCDRLCLPLSPFHHLKNDFQDFLFWKKAGAIKGNNLYILAAYRCFFFFFFFF